MEQKRNIVLGIIPARGSSRRVPRKNIKQLGGKPLIAWTIEAAKEAKSLNDFIVSTDDIEIAKICRSWGARAPFKRPATISTDCDSSLVLRHAIKWYEHHYKDCFVTHAVCLQPTSPFRQGHDIDRCVQIAQTMKDAETVLSVCQVRQHPAWCFELDAMSKLKSFLQTDLAGDNLVWQNLPLLLYPNGAVYVTRRDLIISEDYVPRIYGDILYGYTMPKARSMDLEEEVDFIQAEAILHAYGRNPEELLQNSWKES